jgi:hypothetical protein
MSQIHAVDGVSYANMVLEIYKALTANYQSNYDYGATLDATDILPESVRLFVDGDYVISDTDNGDGTGSFTMASTYTISGTINYSTGLLLLDINPSPASSIHVRYQQDEDRNIVPSLTQIAKLYDTDFTSVEIE